MSPQQPNPSSRPAPRDRELVLHLTEAEYELLNNLALIKGDQMEDFVRQAALNRAELQRITWAEINLVTYFEDIVNTNPRYVDEIKEIAESILSSLKLYKRIFLR